MGAADRVWGFDVDEVGRASRNVAAAGAGEGVAAGRRGIAAAQRGQRRPRVGVQPGCRVQRHLEVGRAPDGRTEGNGDAGQRVAARVAARRERLRHPLCRAAAAHIHNTVISPTQGAHRDDAKGRERRCCG